MKKVLTVAVALVMAFSLSMPAFAAATEGQMANEGKLVQQIGNALTENKLDAAAAAAEQVVTAISEENSDVSKMTAQHVSAVLGKMEENYTANPVTTPMNDGVVVVTGDRSTANDVTVTGMNITPAADGKAATITLDAEYKEGAVKSGLGYKVTLQFPAKNLCPNGDLAQLPDLNSIHLTYTADDGSVQTLDSVLQAYNFGETVMVTIWVPHFSTYNVVFTAAGNVNQPVLPTPTPAPTAKPEPQPEPDPAPAATPVPAPVENPIKKTGADMSVALTALAVVAGAALVGGVAIMKKSDLDQ